MEVLNPQNLVLKILFPFINLIIIFQTEKFSLYFEHFPNLAKHFILIIKFIIINLITLVIIIFKIITLILNFIFIIIILIIFIKQVNRAIIFIIISFLIIKFFLK